MTPVGVFFICQNEDKCHFVNSTKMSRSAGFGEAPQQAFLRPSRAAKIASVATLALLAVSALPIICEKGEVKDNIIFPCTQMEFCVLS